MIFGSGIAESFHLRWFEGRLPASRRHGPTARGAARRLRDRRAALARAAGAAHRRRRVGRGLPFLPFAGWTSPWRRPWWPGSGSRATRLRDLCGGRLPARGLRHAGRGRRGSRPSPFRGGAAFAAAGEKLWHLAARVHAGLHAVPRRASPASSTWQGRFRRPRGGGSVAGRALQPCTSPRWWSTRSMPTQVGDEPVFSEGSRGGLRHIRRLWPYRRQKHRARLSGAGLATPDAALTVEILGARRAAPSPRAALRSAAVGYRVREGRRAPAHGMRAGVRRAR